jgi:PHS family inorganic phosphate transporter-like MFS transporter
VLIVYGINSGYSSTTRQGLIFLLFATFMALGALYSWAYLPDVQRVVYGGTGTGAGAGAGAGDGGGKKRFENRNLEELGEGFMRARQEGLVIGVGEKWEDLKGKVRKRRTERGMRKEVVIERATPPPPPGPAEVDGNGVA